MVGSVHDIDIMCMCTPERMNVCMRVRVCAVYLRTCVPVSFVPMCPCTCIPVSLCTYVPAYLCNSRFTVELNVGYQCRWL